MGSGTNGQVTPSSHIPSWAQEQWKETQGQESGVMAARGLHRRCTCPDAAPGAACAPQCRGPSGAGNARWVAGAAIWTTLERNETWRVQRVASSLLGSGTSVTKGRVVAGTPGLQAHPISALAHLRARKSQAARSRGPSPHPPGRLRESLGSPDSALALPEAGLIPGAGPGSQAVAGWRQEAPPRPSVRASSQAIPLE